MKTQYCQSCFQQENRSGAALVELAVLLPMLMLLMIGTIEVGQAITVKQSLSVAARTGARLYATPKDNTLAKAQTVVDNYLKAADLEGYTATFEPETLNHLEPVTVTITIPYQEFAWLNTNWIFGGEIIQASCVMPIDLNINAVSSDVGGGTLDGDESGEGEGGTTPDDD